MIWSSTNISYQMNMFLIVNNDISTNDGSFLFSFLICVNGRSDSIFNSKYIRLIDII